MSDNRPTLQTEHAQGKVQYILRPLLPILLDDALWKPFMAYAKEIRADAVMAMNLHLEANHPDLRTLQERLPLLAERFREVRAAGMSPMINYYVTLGHSGMPPDRHAEAFTSLVDGHGNAIPGCPCPLCPEFRDYISQAYALFASLDIDAMWIDDDFRLHGRRGSDTFQCFCDLHLAAFARKREQAVPYDRELLIGTLLKPPGLCTEEELRLRLDWRTFQEEVLTDTLRLLRDACVSANPGIAMGIMTNSLESVLLNGRHLDAEIAALRTPAQAEPWVRIGGAAYTDENLPGMLDRCQTFDDLRSTLREPSAIGTEIELFPWTVGGKSARGLALEMYQLTLAVSPLLTLSINDGFLGMDDLSGNYRKTLGPLKTYLQAVSDAQQGKRRRGASLPIPTLPAVTARMDLQKGVSVRWNQALARIGIPVAASDRAVTLITLQEATAYSQEELNEWLTGGAIVTSEAYYYLRERGMLLDCPIEVKRGDMTHTMCFERVTTPSAPSWLRDKDTISWVYMPMHTEFVITAKDGAEAWTVIRDNLGNVQSHGVTVVRTPQHNIAVVPHTGDFLQETGRQWLYQQLMNELTGGDCPAMVEFGVNICPVWWEGGNEAMLGIANFSLECYPSLDLWIPTSRKLAGVQRLGRDGTWEPANCTCDRHPNGGIRMSLRGPSVPEGASFETFLLLFADCSNVS
ncbi:hypothetical protein [Cohnella silvisoli]|uniref:Uncharacterized protein n=1 Tax=Cohnella silvisoli TaxID=2873699 RepID=A0ABV1L2E1_9BACL|nr:hypothetical protein [Cohnella silvisoli]MCD9021600.1 hypothetical protein [Cohnella silvisoli]